MVECDDLEVSKWLTPLDYSSQQRDYHDRHQQGTGVWFLNSTEYETWQEEQNQTLFCYGQPGSGKTILTSMAINDICNRHEGNASVGVAYIYCNLRRTEEQKIDDLLASLLKQLLGGKVPVPECATKLFLDHEAKNTRPSRKDLSEALLEVSVLHSKVFIIIDALDECQFVDGHWHDVLAEIAHLQQNASISAFISSRATPKIPEQFSNAMEMEIRATQEDIGLYLNNRMDQLPSFVESNLDLQEEIRLKIIEAADGIFLLAQLFLDSLKSKMTIKEIRSALNDLATKTDPYEHAYTNAMNQIREQVSAHRRLAKKVILWTTFAKRSLTATELQHVLAVEDSQTEFDRDNIPSVASLVSVCAGLVTVGKESDIIRLVHPTAQEYFRQMQERWFSKAHLEITRACLTYLSFDSFKTGCCKTNQEFENRLQSFPFYEYAANYWAGHAHLHPIETRDQVLKFLKSGAKLEAAEQAAMASGEHYGSSQMVPQHVKGHETVSRLLLQGDTNVKGSDTAGGTLLHHAALSGDETTVQLLLDGGAVCDAVNTHHNTPLCEASRNGHEGVVGVLLKHGARANWAGSLEDNLTPLMNAVTEGHYGVVQLLLENGAKVDGNYEEGSYSWTPLTVAAMLGHEAVARSLLQNGAKVDGNLDKSRFCWTPLFLAAQNGHETVVKLLIEEGAKIKLGGTYQDAPLSIATIGEQEAILQILRSKEAIVEDPARPKKKQKIKIVDEGETPIVTAARSGQGAIVRLLIEKGANPNGKSRYIHSFDATVSLGWAILNGYERMSRLLLENGAEVNFEVDQGNDLQTLLFVAAKTGNTAMINLLLEKGAKLELGQRHGEGKYWGETPLFIAAMNGHKDAVKILLQNGADAKAKMNYASDIAYRGHTPLIAAAERGHESVVRLLLESRADIEARTRFFETNALLSAADKGHTSIVWMLIEKGADIETKSRGMDGTNGLTPLIHAAKNGRNAVVKLLLDLPKRAKIEAKCNGDGASPLLWAARNGHESTVRLLVEKGAVIETKTKFKHMTPLMVAAKEGHADVVKLLLDHGADLEAKDSVKRMTPLAWAVKKEHESVVELLRERGASTTGGWLSLPRRPGTSR